MPLCQKHKNGGNAFERKRREKKDCWKCGGSSGLIQEWEMSQPSSSQHGHCCHVQELCGRHILIFRTPSLRPSEVYPKPEARASTRLPSQFPQGNTGLHGQPPLHPVKSYWMWHPSVPTELAWLCPADHLNLSYSVPDGRVMEKREWRWTEPI